MSSNKKITLMIFAMITTLSIIIVVLVAIGSRQTGYEGAKKKAYLTADIVKKSLTSHMVNGNMEKRDIFLNSISQLENVKDLWVIRAKSVSEQFGKSMLSNENPKDEIDKEVLQTGKEKTQIEESLFNAIIRVTIPYTASSNDKPNCLKCHNAKEGEVLGAISLTFDIREDRISNIIVLLYVIITICTFLTIILIYLKTKIVPYAKSFDHITETLKKVHEGDYSVRVSDGFLKEDKEASIWLNDLINKLDTVLTGIEKNLTSFVQNRSISMHQDKLINAKEIIEDISQIYNFKKTIENDSNKDDIYYRLISVLEEKLKIKYFCIFETDLSTNERKIIYSTEEYPNSCCNLMKNIKNSCRAERTNSIVSSENFPHICNIAKWREKTEHICIPFLVNEQINIVIHIISKDNEDLKHIKYQIGIIKKYLEESKPILESKILMDVLKQKNLTDALTGLYNRKYLDEFIDKKLSIEIRNGNSFAIMFLDIDYFKAVNDNYGHDVGDDILRKLANTMKKLICENDSIIRYGGEEFLILMKNATIQNAKELAEKINSEFSKIVFEYNGDSFNKSVSIGYSFFPKDADEIYKCIKYADISLYEAKSTGRNKVIRFTPDILKNSKKINQ